jgi:hypothetical protein
MEAGAQNLLDAARRPKAVSLKEPKVSKSDAPNILFALFTRPVFSSSAAGLRDCAGDSKSSKKQIAMIAQKIIDANHAKQQRRRLVAAPDARTATLRTVRFHH